MEDGTGHRYATARLSGYRPQAGLLRGAGPGDRLSHQPNQAAKAIFRWPAYRLASEYRPVPRQPFFRGHGICLSCRMHWLWASALRLVTAKNWSGNEVQM
jgi:hypothetical protein